MDKIILKTLNKIMIYFNETKKVLSVSGIYSITNRVNEKRYIGSSVNIYRRVLEHRRQLNKQIHTNPHLQSAYQIAEFDLEVIENCLEAVLSDRESYWINQYKTLDNSHGYNLADVTQTRRNKLTATSKMKISAGLMNKHYKNGSKGILMVCKSSEKTLNKFTSLKEAACYLRQHGHTEGQEHVVRNVIGRTLKGKTVHTGNGNIATRRSAFGFIWRY